MDIKGDKAGPAGLLSNVTHHGFIFDGVTCDSMEGLLQSFKIADPEEQIRICQLSWREAQKKGRAQNWQEKQELYWQGRVYERQSLAYQELLDRAYEAKMQNPDFQEALLASRDAVLEHTIGNSNARATVLTSEEFLIRLNWLRKRLLQGEF